MKNGDVNEFVDGLNYGYELWFLYKGIKYFIEGWTNDGIYRLVLEQMEPNSGTNEPMWQRTGLWGNRCRFAEEFLQAPLFDGKTFWEVEQEIEWVDD